MRGGVYIEVGKWRKDWKEERRDERSGGCQRVERNGNGLLLSLLRLIGSGISLSLSLLFAFVFFPIRLDIVSCVRPVHATDEISDGKGILIESFL